MSGEHPTGVRASERLKGALQNVGLEVILKTGRADAEYSARLLGAVDPLSVKHTVADEAAVERTHPTFFPLSEQWESYTQAIQQLHCGQAFIRLPDDTVRRVTTPTLPAVSVPKKKIQTVERYYLTEYFRPAPRPTARAAPKPTEVPARSGSVLPIRRHHPDEDSSRRLDLRPNGERGNSRVIPSRSRTRRVPLHKDFLRRD